MRVLIVDDSRFLRERMKQILLPLGWEFVEAADGSEGLDALRADEGFDLVLLDVNMPRMSGLECLQKLRGEGLAPAAKVMMVTTEAESSFILQALDDGADEFLMKPFTQESVQGKLLLLGFPLGQKRQMRAA